MCPSIALLVINMKQGNQNSLPFYIAVEGQAHSNHRNPRGVYLVEVIPEQTLVHSACAAILVAKESVPFLNESPDSFTMRVFNKDGHEVVIPRPLTTAHEFHGCFHGRSSDHPDTITLQ